LRAYGAWVAQSPSELLDADVVITMLADDAAVDAVWLGRGLIQHTRPVSVHLNMASVGLRMGRRLEEAHRAAGTPYVAAPVFGRPEPAASGQLDIVAAGPAAALARCVPVFEVLGRRWFNVGAQAHQANIVKIARNFLLGTIIESLGEAFALVQKSGVDPAAFLDILTNTSLNAPAYRNYGRFILEEPERPTFPLRLGLKDIEATLEAGGDTRVPMPFATLLRAQHLAAMADGYGEREWASLAHYIAAQAGLGKAGR
jgi:3-hydroxyisobutyrate dehydrogenase-like beta-hydroxyacid dehydrogenase